MRLIWNKERLTPMVRLNPNLKGFFNVFDETSREEPQ